MATLRRITTTLPRPRVSVLRDYGIVVSFIALFVTLSIASPVFFTKVNLLNVVDQSAAVGLIACGGTLVIIAGGFDLSVGGIYAISGVVAAELVPHVGAWPAIALGALAGAGFGLVNGLLTTVGRINPIITTLATALMIRGLAVAITGGFLVRVDDPAKEIRLFMNPTDSQFAALDRQLCQKAGIADKGQIILQFYPNDTAGILYTLEQKYAGARKKETIRGTVFRVKHTAGTFQFSVEDQSYRY